LRQSCLHFTGERKRGEEKEEREKENKRTGEEENIRKEGRERLGREKHRLPALLTHTHTRTLRLDY
jgi:hypothetical protein